MPKDTATDESYATGGDSSKTLKRGDACLYCRKRRIRCSGGPSTCEHCKKLRRECVYDTGKPVSRVKQLEEKVAELEAMLGGGKAGPSRNGSGSGMGSKGGVGMGSGGSGEFAMPGNGFPHPQGPPIDFSNIFAGNDMAAPGLSGGFRPSQAPSTSFFPQFNNTDISIEDTFDFSMLDPNFMNLVNTFADTSTGSDPFAAPFGQSNGSAPAPPVPAQASNPSSMQYQTTVSDELDDSALFELFTNPNPSNFFDPAPTHGATHTSPPILLDPGPSNGNGNSFPSSSTHSSFSAEPSVPSSHAPPAGPGYQPFPSSQSTPSSNNHSSSSPHFGVDCSDPNGIPDKPPRAQTKTFGLAMASRSGPDDTTYDPAFDSLPMVGGWFDAADLPTVARDHLLDLFFAGMKIVGQEFQIPRFLASLSLPPLKRPHPCLLYTMYLLASRASTHPPIRALEHHFYQIALTKLEESVSMADRLLDATRAATMLAVYKYGLAKYHEGYMMTGMAARLALSCGLHQIPSSVFKVPEQPYDRRADMGALMRQRAYVLGPPLDAIDLGERIWAFWAVYTVDRCGAISAQWPVAIPDEIISTPFPKPLHEYELGLVSERDDITMSAVWRPSPYPDRPRPTLDPYAPSSFGILHLRALSILERASKLMYLPPEPGWDTSFASFAPRSSRGGDGDGAGVTIDDFLRAQNLAAVGQSSTGHSPSGSGIGTGSADSNGLGQSEDEVALGWTKTAKVLTPRAYEQVRQALLQMEADLPIERQTNWEVWDGGLGLWHTVPGRRKEAVTLHFVIGCSWMFLFDVFCFTADNTLAVNVARRLVETIKVVMQDDSYAEMDVFITMIWSFLVKILIREIKRLHVVGEHAGTSLLSIPAPVGAGAQWEREEEVLMPPAAGPIETEVEIVVQALKQVGLRYNIASMQALRADRYRKSAPQSEEY